MQKREIGILSLLSIVNDCKIVESPPKLITNVASAMAQMFLIEDAISRHPFVISIIPSRTQDI